MYYIGIDVGGTNLKAGLVDESYQLVATKKMPLHFTSMEQMGETLTDMALGLVEENGLRRDQVASIGMGFPGSVDNRRGVVIKTVNIPIRFMPVAEMVHRRWDVPVYLGNDADCAALGEYYHYGDDRLESLILVTLGTGIGTGIILGGKIQAGCNGFGGEGGHIVIVHGGEPCTCGRRGCWERYASASALVRQTKAAMEADPGSAMWQAAGSLDQVDGRTAFAAMRSGDAAAKAVVAQYLDYLAEGLEEGDSLWGSYDVKTINDELLSLVVSGEISAPSAAYPFRFQYTYNIDMKTGENIRLAHYRNVDQIAENMMNGDNYRVIGALASEFQERLTVLYGDAGQLALSLRGFDFGKGQAEQPAGYSWQEDGKTWLSIEVPHALGDYVNVELE